MDQKMNRKPYVREMTPSWIFRHPRYVRYMGRELSCLFIGGWTLLMVWGLKQLAEGPVAWSQFLELLRSPASIVFHVLALAFATYHSITWFKLAPKALPVQVGEEFLPEAVVAGAHFGAWAVLSLAVLYFAGVL
jgi:fumarate reductase subunit C